MKHLLPLLFLAGCVPEPVYMVKDVPTVSLPLTVCSQERWVRQAVRETAWQLSGAVALGCPGNVSLARDAARVGHPEDVGGWSWQEGDVWQIRLVNVDPEDRSWVLAHELGHGLGLADDDRCTAMSDHVRAECSRFSDADRAYVRSRMP